MSVAQNCYLHLSNKFKGWTQLQFFWTRPQMGDPPQTEAFIGKIRQVIIDDGFFSVETTRLYSSETSSDDDNMFPSAMWNSGSPTLATLANHPILRFLFVI